MDAIFASFNEVERAHFLRFLMQCFGSTYICLWSYFPQPTNHLSFLAGYYQEENSQQPSSSSGTVARRLFGEYCQEKFSTVNDHVPGLAFRNSCPYIELKDLDLARTASTDSQRQFYQEARIKTAVFMGCTSGEIELGWSNVTPVNIENQMRNWFPEDFSRQSQHFQAIDPSRPSSSSSSLRSLSMDSPDQSSSLIYNIPTTTHIPEALQEPASSLLQPMQSITSPLQEALQFFQPQSATSTSPTLAHAMQSLQPQPSPTRQQQQAMQSLQSILPNTSTNPLQEAMQTLQPIQSTTTPHQRAMQEFALARNIQLPTPESEHAAMTRAFLAVLTSPTSSSSSTPSLPYSSRVSQGSGAFKNYRSALAPSTTQTRASSIRRQSMLKQVITYYRSFNFVRGEHMLAGRPTSTQLHHMISERRRREKINENFQALRSLLPPETKKDKASVLTRTREYLASLKAQVEELSKRNQQLEAQLLSQAAVAEAAGESSNERLDVRVTHVPESTSEQRIVDLQVSLRGEFLILDVVIRILEFLKQVSNVNLVSIEASTHSVAESSTSFTRVILRLNIEGDDWDESAFQEAVKRVVSDLAH